MTNLNIAKLYLANNTNATAAQIDTAVTDGTALTAINALTTAQFVEAAYQAAFGRAADAEGLAYWSNEIDVNGMAKDDAFMTALNYGATVYVAPTVENPLVIGTETFTAATVSATDDVVVAAAKATAEAAASSASVGSVAAAVVDVVDTTTATAAAVVIDAADAVADAAAAAAAAAAANTTVSLTTSNETVATTTGNNIITATAGTLNTGDVILDASTTDSDVLNASISTAGLATTLKNIEAVNLTWTNNTDFDFDAVNSQGNTYNLTATGLAFSGNSQIDNLGSNTVNADSTITGELDLVEIVQATADAGAATTIKVDAAAAMPTVGTTSSVDITVNNDITAFTNDTTDIADITLRASVEGTSVTLATGSQIATSLIVAGDKSMTIVNDTLTTDKIVNSLTGAATLTVKAGDAGAINTLNIDADVINLTAAATAVTVADNQNFLVNTAAAATLASFTDGAGVTNATVNLESQMGVTAITALNITAIAKLNLDVEENTTITTFTVDANNTTVITGDSNLELTTIAGAAVSIDATDLTGKLTIGASANSATGILGSTTAVNTITMGNTTTNGTIITGSANDVIDASTLTSGKVTITTGTGDDSITIDDALTTGKVIIDAGAGTDTLTFTTVSGGGDYDGALQFDITGVENLVMPTASILAGFMLSEKTYTVKGTGANDGITVNVVDLTGAATAMTTDLSTLTISDTTGANVATIAINGTAGVADTIKDSSVADTIIAGGGSSKDMINLNKGGSDTVDIATANDSTYATGADYMDTVTGFSTAATAVLGADILAFATAGTIATSGADVDVSGDITSPAGGEVVVSNVADGILTVSGINSDAIDTLVEWIAVAETAMDNDGTLVAGDTVAFEFSGNTYVYTADTIAAAAITSGDIVELTGLTGVLGLEDSAFAANQIHIA